MRIPANTGSRALQLAIIPTVRKIHIRVVTAGKSIRLAKDRSDIEIPSPLSGGNGLIVSDTDGTVEIEWVGPLFAISNDGTAPEVSVVVK